MSEFQNDEMRFGIASGPVRHPMEIQQPRHAGRLLPMAAGSKNKFPKNPVIYGMVEGLIVGFHGNRIGNYTYPKNDISGF